MKSYNNLFSEIVTEENIQKAMMNASKRKRGRDDVKAVLNNMDYHIQVVKNMLENDTYIPRYNAECQINDGSRRKERTIRKPDFKYDQIIHHAIIQVLIPCIRKGMYEYTCGSIPSRGVHYGKKYVERWLFTDRKNTKYVCKMDIHHFYASVDHDVLKTWLRKKIRDIRTLKLLDDIIDSCEEGLPLGYYTSQWFANFLLQPLDHYIKEELRAVYYIRYMDDMCVFGRNKRELHRIRQAISDFLAEMKLELKGNWQVFRFDYLDKKTGNRKGRPLDFMGFQFYRDRTIMRESIMLRASRKARKIAKKQKVTWYDATAMVSYMGWIDNTDTYGMYLQHIKPYVNIKCMKQIISKHQRRVNKRNDRLERSSRKSVRKTKRD